MHTAKVTRDAAGVPTGLNSIVSSSLVGGMIAGLTQIASPDDLVIPGSMVEKLAVEATSPLLAAAFQKKQITGSWGIPFTKAE